jgi:hypothetical protein
MPAPIMEKMLEVIHGTDVSLEIFISEELEKMPPCDSLVHAEGRLGHVPEEPAAFLFIPGCGHDRMLCKAWVNQALSGEYAFYQCSRCEERTPLSQAVAIPLDI